jgi:type IV pilus assembly protein PilB
VYYENNAMDKITQIPDEFRGVLPRDEYLEDFPIELIREFKAFIFHKDEYSIHVAALNPQSPNLSRYLQSTSDKKISWYFASDGDISNLLEKYGRDFLKDIMAVLEVSSGKLEQNGATSRIVDLIIEYALAEKASDVHIEPSKGDTNIRFRVDGILRNVLMIPKAEHRSIISHFKVLANLKIDESRRPQEGRIQTESFGDIMFRLSTVPTLFGEKAVIRILDDSNKHLDLKALGFTKKHEDIIMRNIEKPFGMILASGPTGSGKTTTLYALMQALKRDDLNISTLEDPVEYALEGVNQIQINSKVELSFASGLRALLRQDPDVIMVGEIRDSETAVMASDAAMTGHLVFSTVHTNNAASVFIRLLEMSVEDFVVSATVNFIVGQRLVRTICKECTTEERLNESTLKKLLSRKDILSVLEKKHTITKDNINERVFRKGAGCRACFQSGYANRIGIYELLELNKEIREMILSSRSNNDIRKAAEENNFISMVEDGIEKVMSGITTFEEVIRTTKDV